MKFASASASAASIPVLIHRARLRTDPVDPLSNLLQLIGL